MNDETKKYKIVTELKVTKYNLTDQSLFSKQSRRMSKQTYTVTRRQCTLIINMLVDLMLMIKCATVQPASTKAELEEGLLFSWSPVYQELTFPTKKICCFLYVVKQLNPNL